MNNIYRNGFSLVELMIVSAGLSALVLVGAQITKSQTKSIVKSSLDSDIVLTLNEINGLLSDPVKCLATLGGKSAISTSTGINSMFGGRYFSIASGSAPAGGYGNSKFLIESYAIASTASDVASNYSYLLVNFQNKNLIKGQSGSSFITKKINLYVEVDGSNNIVKCRSLSNSTTTIWTRGTGNIIFYSGGNVGVGTNSPRELLEVQGNILIPESSSLKWGAANVSMQSDTGGNLIFSSGGMEKMRMDSNGNLGINKITMNSKIDVTGDIRASGILYGTSMQYTSDAKFKYNIMTIENPLEIIKNLNGVVFNWKKSHERDYGFIAQQVKKVTPELVNMSPDKTYLTVDYSKVVPILVEALKNQQKEIETLKEKISVIEEEKIRR